MRAALYLFVGFKQKLHDQQNDRLFLFHSLTESRNFKNIQHIEISHSFVTSNQTKNICNIHIFEETKFLRKFLTAWTFQNSEGSQSAIAPKRMESDQIVSIVVLNIFPRAKCWTCQLEGINLQLVCTFHVDFKQL